MDKLIKLHGELMRGAETAQDPKYHPEGNVYNHSLLVFALASMGTYDIDLTLAAIFHDLGKVGYHYDDHSGHALRGAEAVKNILSAKTCWLIENHMRVGKYKRGELKDPKKIEAMTSSPWYDELCMLHEWDRAARVPHSEMTLLHLHAELETWLAYVVKGEKI